MMSPTFMTLQLADKSERRPRGVVEDVMVQIGEFVYLVDFVVLDMEIGHNSKGTTPVLLRRPFLATADATINCRTGLLELRFGNMKSSLKVATSANKVNCDVGSDEECVRVDAVIFEDERVTRGDVLIDGITDDCIFEVFPSELVCGDLASVSSITRAIDCSSIFGYRLCLGIDGNDEPIGWFVHKDELPSEVFEKKGQNDFDFPMASAIKGLFLDGDPLIPLITSIFQDSYFDGFSHDFLDLVVYSSSFELRHDPIRLSLVPWDIKHQWL